MTRHPVREHIAALAAVLIGGLALAYGHTTPTEQAPAPTPTCITCR